MNLKTFNFKFLNAFKSSKLVKLTKNTSMDYTPDPPPGYRAWAYNKTFTLLMLSPGGHR